jgi:hypothetical protein
MDTMNFWMDIALADLLQVIEKGGCADHQR